VISAVTLLTSLLCAAQWVQCLSSVLWSWFGLRCSPADSHTASWWCVSARLWLRMAGYLSGEAGVPLSYGTCPFQVSDLCILWQWDVPQMQCLTVFPPPSALYWFNYELVKAQLCEQNSAPQTSFTISFTAGAVSGAVSIPVSPHSQKPVIIDDFYFKWCIKRRNSIAVN